MDIDKNIRKKNVKNIILKIRNIINDNKINISKDTNIENISALIESGILKFSMEYTETNNTPFLLEPTYNEKTNNILQVINKHIIEAIINKLIEPKKLAFMRDRELNPNKFKKIKQKKNKISELKDKTGEVNLYTCKKCGGNRTKVKELQIERGDEPTNFFITCLDCGHVEKQ